MFDLKMINTTFKSRKNIFLALIISIILNIIIGLIGFYIKWGSLPSFSDTLIVITLMTPFVKPLAFGGILKLLNPFSQGTSWHIAFLLYWPTILGLLFTSFKTMKIWPFFVSTIIGIIGSPFWFIIGVPLFYI